MESQAHGNLFEDVIIRSVANVGKKEYEKLIPRAYTSPMDIHEGVKSDFNASVKTTKGNGIGLGDMGVFYDHATTTEFIMIVGCWEQETKTQKSFHTIYEFDCTPDNILPLFGSLTREDIRTFREYVVSIPNGKQGQLDNQTLWKEKRQVLLDKGNPIVSIDAKIDSKTQRRVQSGVKIQSLIDQGIPYRKITDNYRGIDLPLKIKSGARQFAKSKAS